MSKLEIRTNGETYQSIDFGGTVIAIVGTKAGGGQFVIEQDSLAYIDLRGARQVGPVVADPDWNSGAVIMSAQFRIDKNTPDTVDVNFDVRGGADTDERSIDFGDGTVVTDQSNNQHTYAADGDYTITVGFAGLTAVQQISFPVPDGISIDSWLPFGYPWPGTVDEPPADDPDATPTQKSTKIQILSWLSNHGVQLSADAEHQFTKDELLEIVKNFQDDEKDPVGLVVLKKEKAEKAQAAKDAKADEKDDKAPAKK